MTCYKLSNILIGLIETRCHQSDLSCGNTSKGMSDVCVCVCVFVHAGISQPKGRLLLGRITHIHVAINM